MEPTGKTRPDIAALLSPTEEEFLTELQSLVRDTAPRLFALLEEAGEREDAWVHAWGLAVDERAYVIRGPGAVHTFRSAESARHRLSGSHRKLRLMWCDPVPVAGTAAEPETPAA
jgi:hypothetical protein